MIVIYFDLSKAFDKVPHRRLLIKLEAIGIRRYEDLFSVDLAAQEDAWK
ncbi:unnamed protein product, partial [Dibothriocephalus latus]